MVSAADLLHFFAALDPGVLRAIGTDRLPPLPIHGVRSAQ